MNRTQDRAVFLDSELSDPIHLTPNPQRLILSSILLHLRIKA